ncbi:MAG: polysaccharide deacetylase family protein [candidate division Zixibacteria bacterium]|nr:polysaccharide deacetylase family protein [candidate division Zixibacteria bacterium]
MLWRIKYKKPPKATVPILAYHQVSDRFDLSITRQKVSQFEKGIRFLYEQGYKAIRLEEIFNSNEEYNGRKVAITFDDGYEDVYLNAFPLLQKLGFTASIFVITGYVGKYNGWDYNWGRNKKKHLSWEQIKEMADAGFGFGSHTVNHPDLTKIPQQFVEYELKRSKQVLEDKLGQRVDFLSYPFGRYNRYVQKEAERLGYKGAYTLCSNSKQNDFHPFSQKRWGVYLLDSSLTLKIKLNQGKLFWIEDMKGRVINKFPSWTIILKGSPNYDRLNTTSLVA